MLNVGFQELLMVVGLILFLVITGLWTPFIRALREFRGEAPQQQAPATGKSDLELCYRILGVSPTSAWEEIEKAYRRKAKQFHPDLGGDEDMMRAVNEAYAMIKKVRR
ncbi:MAG: hypothetical protein AMXMBFR84_11280 [Candidatus Hydrogenedentota bacterium]